MYQHFKKSIIALIVVLITIYLCTNINSSNDSEHIPLINEFIIECDSTINIGPPYESGKFYFHNNIMIYEHDGYYPLVAYSLDNFNVIWKSYVSAEKQIGDKKANECDFDIVITGDFYDPGTRKIISLIYGDTLIMSTGIPSRPKLYGIDINNGQTLWEYNHHFEEFENKQSILLDSLLIQSNWTNFFVFNLKAKQKLLELTYNKNADIMDTIIDNFKEPHIDYNDKCSISWAIGEKIYLINPYNGNLCKTLEPAGVKRPHSIGDGYQGLGSYIENVTGDEIMVFQDISKYGTEKLFKINITENNAIWTYNLGEFRGFMRDFVKHENKVILWSWKKHILCLDYGSGEVKWKFEIIHPEIDSVSISDNILYCASLNESFDNNPITTIYALNINTGELIWGDVIKGKIVTPPTVHRNKLYILTTQTGKNSINCNIRVYNHSND